ncbi:MAG: hypothetical protein E5V48_02530 [Mesorhizobium sp.]|nr:MAG: hypothetical protein E5V48_02530 [Mesorhizobium sp.]
MTRSLAISARQITAICKGVAKAGFVAEVVINGIVVRLVPEGRPESEDVSGLSDWSDWKFPEPTPRSSKKQPSPGVENALADYYKKLGYDPQTMSRDDLKRLIAEADARWKAEIPTLPLNKRERTLLANLAPHAGGMIATSAVKGVGADTVERLTARKFVTVTFLKGRDFPNQIMLTPEGLAAASQLQT